MLAAMGAAAWMLSLLWACAEGISGGNKKKEKRGVLVLAVD